jgi:hypothetical protein
VLFSSHAYAKGASAAAATAERLIMRHTGCLKRQPWTVVNTVAGKGQQVIALGTKEEGQVTVARGTKQMKEGRVRDVGGGIDLMHAGAFVGCTLSALLVPPPCDAELEFGSKK